MRKQRKHWEYNTVTLCSKKKSKNDGIIIYVLIKTEIIVIAIHWLNLKLLVDPWFILFQSAFQKELLNKEWKKIFRFYTYFRDMGGGVGGGILLSQSEIAENVVNPEMTWT